MATAAPTASAPHLGLGTGIYTIGEAARLLHAHANSVRRWAEGYSYCVPTGVRCSAPVLDRSDSEPGLLTFRELIELHFVKAFRSVGVDLPLIRSAAARLREEWSTPFPFAVDRLRTDGRRLLLDAGGQYRDLASHQHVFEFADAFFRNLDLDEELLAVRWWPMGKGRLVVLDPSRSFGVPIEVRSGVATDVAYRAYRAEGSVAAVVDWYEMTEQGVTDAVEFEAEWLKKAA